VYEKVTSTFFYIFGDGMKAQAKWWRERLQNMHGWNNQWSAIHTCVSIITSPLAS